MSRTFNPERAAVNFRRLPHRVPDLVCDRLGVVRPVDVLQEHHEFVTSESGDRIRLAYAELQPARDFPQQQIPACVSEGIIDPLEIIDVDVQDRQGALLSDASRDCGSDAVLEQASVRQTGEFVVLGSTKQFGLHLRAVDRNRNLLGNEMKQLPVLVGVAGLGVAFQHQDADRFLLHDERQCKPASALVARGDVTGQCRQRSLARRHRMTIADHLGTKPAG